MISTHMLFAGWHNFLCFDNILADYILGTLREVLFCLSLMYNIL